MVVYYLFCLIWGSCLTKFVWLWLIVGVLVNFVLFWVCCLILLVLVLLLFDWVLLTVLDDLFVYLLLLVFMVVGFIAACACCWVVFIVYEVCLFVYLLICVILIVLFDSGLCFNLEWLFGIRFVCLVYDLLCLFGVLCLFVCCLLDCCLFCWFWYFMLICFSEVVVDYLFCVFVID